MPTSELELSLDAELEQLEQLLGLLKKEQQLLTERKLDDLIPLLEEKTTQLRHLENRSQARRQAFAKLGISDQAGPIRSWLHTHQSNLLPKWEQLLDKARMAELLNRTNGQLISTRQEIEQQFLQQAVRPDSDELPSYSADGKISSAGSAARRRDLV
ncbi:flagella synthesis protein FlgN [Chitinilyticum aquatile]|uniref:flagella synthesis protein FlgN n=1 Tax=Chitinilyticum aquatile TaxID=362520 RepID=UPI0003FFFC56|nr:flagellar export chaperone FlgN [Chitinilyticum aquatile]